MLRKRKVFEIIFQCCKQQGHTDSECPKDPNIKTSGYDLDEEIYRIEKLMQHQMTKTIGYVMPRFMTRYLSCLINGGKILMPREDIESEETYEKQLPKSKPHPFNRGALSFDDFNYSVFYDKSDIQQLKELLGANFLNTALSGYRSLIKFLPTKKSQPSIDEGNISTE